MSIGGRQVRLFLVDGTPFGIVTAEIMNWSGHALLAPRGEIGRVRNRPEGQKTGIYFLFGEVANFSERRPVYIGESDDVGRRVEQHAASKEADYFERFCIFTSKDANLTKAHARYLENSLNRIAFEAGRSNILNGNMPPAGVLPESDISDMDFFISQIEIILPVLGFDILKRRPLVREVSAASAPSEKVDNGASSNAELGTTKLRLFDVKTGVDATALLTGSEYLVLKGSTARAKAGISLAKHLVGYNSIREGLISDGSLAPHPTRDDLLLFSRDVAFSSPSAASAIIYGRSDNGRYSWKIGETMETLAQFQTRRMSEAAE